MRATRRSHGSTHAGVARIALLAYLLLGAWQPVVAQPAKPITPEDVVALKEVEDPQIAPDGGRVAYVVATPRPDQKPPHGRVMVVGADGTALWQVQAPDAASESHPRWSPDGRRLAFLSDRQADGASTPASSGQAAGKDKDKDDKPKPQVWAVDAPGAAAHRISDAPGGVSDFAWSPDGASIAWIAAQAPSADDREREKKGDDAIKVDDPRYFRQAWVKRLPDGQPVLISQARLEVSALSWSPDGTRLALRVADQPGMNDHWNRARLILVDASDGHVLRTLPGRVGAEVAQWSPDGTRLLYGLQSESKMTYRLVVHQLADDRICEVAADWPGTLWGGRWRDDRTLVLQGQQGVEAWFLQAAPCERGQRPLARVQAPWQSFSVARNGDVAFLGQRTMQPSEVWLLHGRHARALTDTNPQVAGWSLGSLKPLHWRSSLDGRTVHGMVVLPPGWTPAKGPLPLLVQVHGGPAWAWSSGWMASWHEWALMLASHGYAVLLPNPRGSEGQGAEFTEAVRNDWGGGDFQDVMDGVDLVIDQGIADPQRLAIGGWSYGGYLAAWAVGHSPRFRTAIVGAGVTDLYSMAMTTDVLDFLPGYFKGDPLTRRGLLDERSPLRYAQDVNVPVLVLHGQDDERVPAFQGQAFYRALRFNNSPSELVLYPRTTHWPQEMALRRDLLRRVLTWMEEQMPVAKDLSMQETTAPVQH